MNEIRRAIVAMPMLAAGAFVAGLPRRVGAQASTPSVEVWKSPTCGCCKHWVTHMEDNGFRVTIHDSGNTNARARLGIPQRLGSCHTAVVAGYVIEGHVPAEDIYRLLREKPKALGLAVPGMPIGAPGMDGPEYGGRKDAYAVLIVQPGGTTSVYRRHS